MLSLIPLVLRFLSVRMAFLPSASLSARCYRLVLESKFLFSIFSEFHLRSLSENAIN
ncbi:unnamed protein product [Arabidopsis halleri]